MTSKRPLSRGFVSLLLLGSLAAGPGYAKDDSAEVEQLKRALAAELSGVQDTQHPMRYRLCKSSPRYATTKDIFETKDGAVARLVAINNQPLSPVDAQKEQDRLTALLNDPGKQRHRKQAEEDDTNRVVKVIRALPDAFLYESMGAGEGPHGKVEKFSFRPNPNFDPQDLETHVLTELTGEIWVDPAQTRVVRLEGHLQQDVDFGWGILGRLNKGGWIVLEQAEVGDHQWRIVHFQMTMNGRVFFKTKSFDTLEDESGFVPVPLGTGYAEAIRLLRGDSSNAAPAQ
jgi:hypothetical protein